MANISFNTLMASKDLPRRALWIFVVYALGLSTVLFLLAVPGVALAHAGLEDELIEITARIAADPGNAQLYWQRGEVNRQYEHWEQALTDYNKAAQLDPDLDKADLGVGRTRFDQGRYQEAITSLDKFLARQPGNIRGLQTRARARYRLGDYWQAAGDYTVAIDQFQSPQKPAPVFYLERAHAQEAAGSFDVAVQGLDAGLQVLGPIVTLELYAIELQAKSGNTGAALARLDHLIERSTYKDAYLLKRSEILMQAGRNHEARQDLLSALDALEQLPGRRRNTRASKHMSVRIHDYLDELDR